MKLSLEGWNGPGGVAHGVCRCLALPQGARVLAPHPPCPSEAPSPGAWDQLPPHSSPPTRGCWGPCLNLETWDPRDPQRAGAIRDTPQMSPKGHTALLPTSGQAPSELSCGSLSLLCPPPAVGPRGGGRPLLGCVLLTDFPICSG